MNEIIHGDCLEVMPSIPDKSIDLVVTDPFYGSSGRDGSVHLNDDNIVGNRMSSDSFIWFVRQYSFELFRVTKSDSHCYVFSDWRKYKDVQIAFETNGWELRALIVWNKGNGMGEYWRSSHEFILFFTKRNPKKLAHGGCLNVLSFSPVRGKNKLHGCEKPVDLITYLIDASSNVNNTILDCFSGSGTTAIACINTNRNYICIEKDKAYFDLSVERVNNHKTQTNLFKTAL